MSHLCGSPTTDLAEMPSLDFLANGKLTFSHMAGGMAGDLSGNSPGQTEFSFPIGIFGPRSLRRVEKLLPGGQEEVSHTEQ